MPQVIVGILMAVGLALIAVLKWTTKGTKWGFKKAPLTATLVVLTLLSLPIYFRWFKELAVMNDNPFAEARAMGSFMVIAGMIFFALLQAGLYALIIFIVNRRRANRVDPNADQGAINLRNALINSTHLAKHYAPINDYKDPETHAVLHEERTAKVASMITSVSRIEGKLIPQYMVQFRVETDLETFKRVMPSVKEELMIDAVKLDPFFESGGYIQFIVIPDKSTNPLVGETGKKPAADFFNNFSIADRRWASIPVGLNEDLNVVYMDAHHTLVAGGTGSGKGSVMQVIFQHYLTAPEGECSFYDRGLVKFYLIDPKSTEFAKFRNAEFAETIVNPETGASWKTAFRTDEINLTISAFNAELNRRMEANEELGQRDMDEPTPEMPLLFLMIDELKVAIPKLTKDTKQELDDILALGRSYGMYVIAATQKATMDVIPNRDAFINRIALRLAKVSDAKVVFGAEEADLQDAGVAPHLIPKSTKANGWAHSGRAFVFNDEEDLYQEIRFFYTTDADITEIQRKYTPPQYLSKSAPSGQSATGGPSGSSLPPRLVKD